MKNFIKLLFIFVTVLLLGGCLENNSVDIDNGDYQNDDTYTSGVIPPKTEGVGVEFDIADYLFPYRVLKGGKVEKIYTVTTEDANGYFTDQRTTLTHVLESTIDSLGDISIHLFENGILVEKDTVSPNRIIVNSYQGDGILSAQEQYPRLMRRNEDLLRNDRGACVLKQRIESFDITSIIPVQAYPDPNLPPMVYGSVLHFYCGSVDGTRTDRYYASGWGRVAIISKRTDGATVYSIFDPNTYVEY